MVCLLGGADFQMPTTDATKAATAGALNDANRIKQDEVAQRWISQVGKCRQSAGTEDLRS
ncbi:hypothetical protein X265_13510 [Bradyrhizobium guangdongense]|nr:hypothetical protein X265_13510 [Bradyrhizobium guangdongense]